MEKIRSITSEAIICIIHGIFTQEKLQFLIQKAKSIKADYLNFSARKLSAVDINQIHDAGLKVNVWTVNSPKIMKKYIRWNVDIITTNRPDYLKKLLNI